MGTSKTINLDPRFKEFIKLLNSNDVRYLLLGGYAVNYYGHHRLTADIDFWIALSQTNADKMVLIIEEWGFTPGTVTVEGFLRPKKVHMFGRPPWRIDILSGPSGVDFDACYKRRVIDTIDGVTLPIISLADLRANKLASGRDKDLIDLRFLPKG